MNANEMIERYVAEVGRHLPGKGRADILRELNSLLYDAVEARAGDEEPTAQTVAKVLVDFGEPQAIAAEYRPTQYLIGPQLFPTYRTVATIVLTVISTLFLLLLVLLLWSNEGAVSGSQLWGWLTSYGSALLYSMAITTLIFVVAERIAGNELTLANEQQTWDPFKLPAVDDRNRIGRGELIVDIAAEMLAVSFFVWLIGDGGPLAQFIADEFWQHVPWLLASMIAGIAVKTIVLWQGSWQPVTRVLEIASELFGIYVLWRILSGGAITTIGGLTTAIKLGLGIAIVVTAVGVVVSAVRLLSRRGEGDWAWRPSVSRR